MVGRKRQAFVAAIAILAPVTSSSPASAYRPFDGTDADVAALGDFELELGPVHYYSLQGDRYLIAPATVLNLGFAPGWEAVVDFQNFVGLQSVPDQAQDRLLDTDALVKAILLPGSLQDERRPWPSVAVEFGPLLPNVNGEDGFGASCDVIVSKRWEPATLHLNSWVELTRGDLHFDWFEGAILEGPFAAPFRPVGEIFVEHEWVADVTTLSALLGGIWRAAGGLDLDAGLREARVGDSWVTEVRLGLTWTLGVWRPANEERRGTMPPRSIAAAR